MPVYLFSIGNSDTGPIGADICVHGENAEFALAEMKTQLAEDGGRAFNDENDDDEGLFESASVAVNADVITIDHCLRSETEACTRDDCEFCGDYRQTGRDECVACNMSRGGSLTDRCAACAPIDATPL